MAEETFARTRHYWATVAFANLASAAEEIGWETMAERYFTPFKSRVSEFTTKILEAKKIKERDATAVKQIYEAYGPIVGWKWETPEFEAKRAVYRQVGTCVLWDAIRDVEIQEKFPPNKICETGGEVVNSLVNPNLKYQRTAGLCKGDKYCEFVIEL